MAKNYPKFPLFSATCPKNCQRTKVKKFDTIELFAIK
uniref:Uncharacterized protein n=1 Tax=Myoviridae sp. ctNrE4 TaxID=2825092 RepID=A0A8S5UAD8_9CAUD|nr:MAG TPA: hypothetical protein [Myoviridae sp. ctNrE4]